MTTQSNPLPIRIEDNFEDIIEKAAKGLQLGKLGLMEKSGLSMIDLEPLLNGNFNPTHLYTVASILELNPEALIELGAGNFYPKVEPMDHFFCFNAPFPIPGYEEMTVNSFAIKVPKENKIILFDAGGNFEAFNKLFEKENYELTAIFLTHSHRDHITDLQKFQTHFPDTPIIAHPLENVQDAQPVTDSQTWEWGELHIEAYNTPGHSPGGSSFFIRGLSQPLAVVGDAIFAGSVGGIPSDYPKHLQTLKSFLNDLPNDTLIAPGHGPCTNATIERKSNPFFAESQ